MSLVCKHGLRVDFGNGTATSWRAMKLGVVIEPLTQVKQEFGMVITPIPWERQSQREPTTYHSSPRHQLRVGVKQARATHTAASAPR